MEAILTSTFLINTTKILKFRDKLKQRSNLKFSDGDGPNLFWQKDVQTFINSATHFPLLSINVTIIN